MTNYLPRPDGIDGPEIWVEEAIWGHRFYDEQSPWLTFLEFLTVFTAEADDDRALHEPKRNALGYKPQQQLRLRNVVFNNPFLEAVSVKELSDPEKWDQWVGQMNEHAGGLPTDTDFTDLRDRFTTFDEFARVVGFLRNTALEYESNKRWSSKFVFPFGKVCLYEDVAIRGAGATPTNDRRFFGRSGELLYLMLCRSQHAAAIRELLLDRLVRSDEPLAALASAIQGEPSHAINPRGGSYLPYEQLSDYDALASDWLAILRLPMSIYDALPHLVSLASLHLVRYMLGRCYVVLAQDPSPEFVCEIVGPIRSAIRDISADSYQANNTLPRQAMEHHIRSVTTNERWINALSSRDPVGEASEVLRSEFDWPPEDTPIGSTSANELLDQLMDRAAQRHKQHVGKVHSSWTRDIGLTSRRHSRRNRYAPNDQLLKTIVICRVDRRMEFKEFLTDLAEQYGFVIGDQQAADWINSGLADQQDFSNNARYLERRLASLGLLNRLSDSCAYVENPFAGVRPS